MFCFNKEAKNKEVSAPVWSSHVRRGNTNISCRESLNISVAPSPPTVSKIQNVAIRYCCSGILEEEPGGKLAHIYSEWEWQFTCKNESDLSQNMDALPLPTYQAS